MPIIAANIIPAKNMENAQTTQYVSPSSTTTIIDKFTATNFSSGMVTVSVNLAAVGAGTGNDNLIVKTRTLQPGETYTFPEIVGHILPPGGFVSTLASSAAAVNLRASGREIS
jgi:3-deoxy-D-manno-octulosonic acid (KDO) 8-phosphate synthase|tara:strand:+ start:81 stop:419 length:339 start_codon:yes stop_codon:yes gene_type:complete